MHNDEIRMIISKVIKKCLKKKGIKELAYDLHCSPEYIEKIKARENVGIREDFLQRLVGYIGLKSYRVRGYEETEETYPFDECVELLKSYLVPPQQGNLWEQEND